MKQVWQIGFLALFSFLLWHVGTGVAEAGLVSCGNSVSATNSSSGCSFSDLFETGLKLIEYMLSGAAVVAVGGVVYGGVLMVTSAGNEGRSAAGKKAVTNSLIGLAVILLAFLMVRTLFTVLGFSGTDQILNQPGQFIQGGGTPLITPPQGNTTPVAPCSNWDFVLERCKD